MNWWYGICMFSSGHDESVVEGFRAGCYSFYFALTRSSDTKVAGPSLQEGVFLLYPSFHFVQVVFLPGSSSLLVNNLIGSYLLQSRWGGFLAISGGAAISDATVAECL